MKKCLTKKMLFREVSGCLVENPECAYARKFGFSFVCSHPDHTKFHAHVTESLTRGEINELYNSLKQKRREEFIASLDESSRRYFCYETDFFGRPISGMDMHEQH